MAWGLGSLSLSFALCFSFFFLSSAALPLFPLFEIKGKGDEPRKREGKVTQ